MHGLGLCGVTMGADERINEIVHQWWIYIEIKGNSKVSIAYKGLCIKVAQRID